MVLLIVREEMLVAVSSPSNSPYREMTKAATASAGVMRARARASLRQGSVG